MSVTSRSPDGVKPTSRGLFSWASPAGPPSPENPALPSPATVRIVPVGPDAADAVVAAVGDREAPVGRDCDAGRRAELRERRVAAVARGARRPGPGDGGDDPAGDPADAVVGLVGDQHVPVALDRDAGGLVELRVRRRPAVAVGAGGAGPRDGADRPVPVHPPDPVVVGVGDEVAAVGHERHVGREVQDHLAGRTAVAAEAAPALSGGPCFEVDHAVGPDPTDAVRVAVGDEDRAVGHERHAVGGVELRGRRGPAVAVLARPVAPGEQDDRAVGHDAPDGHLRDVAGDHEAAVGQREQPDRRPEVGCRRRRSVAGEAVRAGARHGRDDAALGRGPGRAARETTSAKAATRSRTRSGRRCMTASQPDRPSHRNTA